MPCKTQPWAQQHTSQTRPKPTPIQQRLSAHLFHPVRHLPSGLPRHRYQVSSFSVFLPSHVKPLAGILRPSPQRHWLPLIWAVAKRYLEGTSNPASPTHGLPSPSLPPDSPPHRPHRRRRTTPPKILTQPNARANPLSDNSNQFFFSSHSSFASDLVPFLLFSSSNNKSSSSPLNPPPSPLHPRLSPRHFVFPWSFL